MTLNANKVRNTGKKAPILEPANYPGRLVQVIDLGLQPQHPWQGEEKPPAYDLWITYELGTEFLKDEDGNDDPEKPRWVSERFSLYSLQSDRAKSTKRYHALDPNEIHGGDWAELLGEPCLIALVTSKCGRYNNVGATSVPIKGMAVPELVNPTKAFDLSDPDMEVFESLPDFLKEIIKGNLEYQGSQLQSLLEGQPVGSPPEPVEELSPEDVPY